MQIGMLDNLQKWIFHFMMKHEPLDKYNAICLPMPAFHDLTPKNTSFELLAQCNEKEVKEMSRYLHRVVSQYLQWGSPTRHPIFNCAIDCTLALLEFFMYARNKSHDHATLSYMADALHGCYIFNDVFLLERPGKYVKAIANALRMELVKKRKVDEETNVDPWTPSTKQREMNAWLEYIRHKMDISNQLDAEFNFPMIHVMSHWGEQIRRYGALQQYSSDTHEHPHKTNHKNSWNTSNHNLNNQAQGITCPRRIRCFEIRELNLQALAQRLEISAAACKVFPSGADRAAPWRSLLYAKPGFMGPQNSRDGKHPDAIMKDFRALLDNTQDATHCVAIYSAMQEFIKYKSCNKTNILDEQLHTMELSISHGIEIQVEG